MPKVDFRDFNPINLAFDVKSEIKDTIVNGKKTTVSYFIIEASYNYLGPNRGEKASKSSKNRYDRFLIQPPNCLSEKGFSSNDKFGGEQIMFTFPTDLGIVNHKGEPVTDNNPTKEDIDLWIEVYTEIRDAILTFISDNYKQFKFTKSSVELSSLKSQPIQGRLCITPEEDQDRSPALFVAPAKYIDKKTGRVVYTLSFVELRAKGREIVEYEYKFRELYGKTIACKCVVDASRIYVGTDNKIRIQPTVVSAIVYDVRKYTKNQQKEELEEHKKNVDISTLKDYNYKDEDTEEVENDLKDLMNDNTVVVEETVTNNSDEQHIIEKKKKKGKKRAISNDVSDE